MTANPPPKPKKHDDRAVKVREIHGDLMRFHVESWSSPAHVHLVDLLSHYGNGECSCTHFVTRCRPSWREQFAAKGAAFRPVAYGRPGATLCRHLEAARRYFLHHLLVKMANDQRGEVHHD